MTTIAIPVAAAPAGAVGEDVFASSVTLDDLTLDGGTFTAAIDQRVVSATIEPTIEGASVLTIEVHDPERKLGTAGLLHSRTTLEVDGVEFRFVKWGGTGSIVRLVFEDDVVARLRENRKPKRAKRGKVTRGKFMVGMVREARPLIPVVAPEQSVQLATASAAANRTSGFAPKAKLTVKGVRANPEQVKVLAAVLKVGVALKAPRKVLEAAIATVIVESTARNLRGGDRDSAGAFQQRPSQGWGTYAQVRNVPYAARKFYAKAITYHAAHRSASVGNIAQHVQRSGKPGEYAKRAPEAARIVNAYVGAGYNPTAGRVTTKRIEYTRGAPGGPKGENTWQALQRLAEEVGWRVWAWRGRIYIMSEVYLFRSAPWATIEPTDPALLAAPDFDVDVGKAAAECTLTVTAARWSVPPGAIVALEGFGPVLDGRWLVSKGSRSLFSRQATVTLTKPRPELPEPEESSGGTGGGSSSSSGGSATFSGTFAWPTTSRAVTSGFGMRNGRMHEGIDIGVPIGTAVRAAGAGKVEFAGVQSGYGNTVIVRHNGTFRTLYAHLNAFECKVGDTVKAGETIAKSGNTGRSTGPHLHFEIQRNGAAVDPRTYLK